MVTIKDNNTVVPSSNVSVEMIGDVISNVSNTIIAALAADDIVTLTVRSDQNVTLNLKNTETPAILTITKID
jgi:hypothetical protein